MSLRTLSVWVLGDQLLLDHPAIRAAEAAVGHYAVRVVLVESGARLAQLPYQRKKIVLVLSAMRHYAAALRRRGYAVDYVRAPDWVAGLRDHLAAHRSEGLLTMAAAEYETRTAQQALGATLGLPVEVLPNTQFLLGDDPFPRDGRRVVLEQFYRALRRRFGLLIEPDGAPSGGRWNFDHDNRRRLPRGVCPPPPLDFEPDELTRQVIDEVELRSYGVGSAHGFRLAVTREQALRALDDFVTHRLASFGPYEDAMSDEHRVLYHSTLAPYLNIGLLEPLELARAAEAAYRAGAVAIQSAEGFIRQVIGWREYVSWHYWRQMPALREQNAWEATRKLPSFFWSGATDLRCLQRAIDRARATGYTHHIERLMLLCNFCLLAGVRPQEVNDWFLAHYIDAYDWVMQPNVIGMGLNADGGQIATKPYIASGAYIRRMGDYCDSCSYQPQLRTGPQACPFTLLYWRFLIEHEGRLRANPRLGPAVLGLARLSTAERAQIWAAAEAFLDELT